MSISDLLDNPFFYTVVGGIITAAVSVALSGRFAERAASNYSIKQGRKREHHLALLDKPTDDLIQQCRDSRQFFQVKINYSRPRSLLAPTIRQVEKGERRDSTEVDFLTSHLDTGYPDEFEALRRHQVDSNMAANAVLEIAREVSMKLMESRILRPQPEIGEPISDWCDYLQVAVDFVGISLNRWERGRNDINLPRSNKVHDELGDGFNVSWVMVVARTSTEEKAEELKSALEALTWSPYKDRLVAVFEQKWFLNVQGEFIREFLEALRVKVRAGVPLRGSCIAGQQADPKFE